MDKHIHFTVCPQCKQFVKVELITYTTDHMIMESTRTFFHCNAVQKTVSQIWKSRFNQALPL